MHTHIITTHGKKATLTGRFFSLVVPFMGLPKSLVPHLVPHLIWTKCDILDISIPQIVKMVKK